MTRLLISVFALLGAFQISVAAQTPQEPAAPAALKRAELFIAIRDNDAAGVKRLLTQGADANSRNWLDFSPLMWAAMCGNQEIVETLFTQGAKFDDDSIYGSALTFAELGRNEKIALFLLDKGAKPGPSRLDKASSLMLAAANGHVSLIERLLKQKCDPQRAGHRRRDSVDLCGTLGAGCRRAKPAPRRGKHQYC